jgi:hypothetical protein
MLQMSQVLKFGDPKPALRLDVTHIYHRPFVLVLNEMVLEGPAGTSTSTALRAEYEYEEIE